MTKRTTYICELTGTSARLLTTEPMSWNEAESAIARLREAEKILPEHLRRKLFYVDLEMIMSKPEGVAASAE